MRHFLTLLISLFLFACVEEIDLNRGEDLSSGVAINGRLDVRDGKLHVRIFAGRLYQFASERNERFISSTMTVETSRGESLPVAYDIDNDIFESFLDFSVAPEEEISLRIRLISSRGEVFVSGWEALPPQLVAVDAGTVALSENTDGEVACLLYRLFTTVAATDQGELGFLYRFRRFYRTFDPLPHIRIFPVIKGAFETDFERFIGRLVPGRFQPTGDTRTVPLFVDGTDSKIQEPFLFDVTQEPLNPAAYAYYEQFERVAGDGRSIFEPAPSAIPGNVTEETDPNNKNVFGYVHATRTNTVRMSYLGSPRGSGERCD